jgi:hypothetical protein
MRRFSTLPVASAIVAASLVAGCSGGHDNVTANATAPAGFVPPTALNRSDFLTMVDHRFSSLDANNDSELSQREIPVRHHDIIESFDTNHDGKVTKDEFEKGALARFDKADINGDGVLTGEERRKADLPSDTDADNAASSTSAANGSATNGTATATGG